MQISRFYMNNICGTRFIALLKIVKSTLLKFNYFKQFTATVSNEFNKPWYIFLFYHFKHNIPIHFQKQTLPDSFFFTKGFTCSPELEFYGHLPNALFKNLDNTDSPFLKNIIYPLPFRSLLKSFLFRNDLAELNAT